MTEEKFMIEGHLQPTCMLSLWLQWLCAAVWSDIIMESTLEEHHQALTDVFRIWQPSQTKSVPCYYNKNTFPTLSSAEWINSDPWWLERLSACWSAMHSHPLFNLYTCLLRSWILWALAKALGILFHNWSDWCFKTKLSTGKSSLHGILVF